MTIDKKHFTLICSQCKVEETKIILDKGNGWAGSDWQSLPHDAFKDFIVDLNGGGKVEPEITKAVCKQCGESAVVNVRYSQ